MRHILVTAAIVALLSACSSTPEVQTGADAEVLDGTNLYKVDNTRADLAYRDPDADFSQFNRVLIRPLGVDNVEIVQPSSQGTSIGRNQKWELTDDDKRKLQDAFMEVMVKRLEEKGGYPIVDEAAEDVLEIGARLLAIAPSAAKDDFQSRPVGRSRVYTEGAGSIAVMVAFGDSETGEVLGLVKDSRSSNSYWGQNNSVSNMADVRRMFDSWAIQIVNALDRVHGK